MESFCGDAREFHCERGGEARWKIKLNPLQGDKSGLAPAFIDPKGDDFFRHIGYSKLHLEFIMKGT